VVNLLPKQCPIMKKLLTTLSILFIATASYAQTYTVERVIDGDTIEVRIGDKLEIVELIGIDAPESEVNDKTKRDSERTGQDIETIIKLGQEATEFVKNILPKGTQVYLQFDSQKRDKDGKFLAYVFRDVELSWPLPAYVIADLGIVWSLVNAEILAKGYAQTLRYAWMLAKVDRVAREQGLGLFTVQCKDDSQCVYTAEWIGHNHVSTCRSSKYWVQGEEKIDTNNDPRYDCVCVEGKCGGYKKLNKEAEGE